ncbi:MAG TPA: hypothetical protein VFR76_01450 [Verrucomicrobiae bacterium]|nr:hypothetical protein [Verrucomicrobiae bacterium]
MPIRLNLLAEAQATEDMRRRDPAKRVIWAAGLLIASMLVWSSSLFLRGMLANRDLGTVQIQMNTRTNQYQHVLDNQKKAAEIKMKLEALHRLATNRFLNGTLLNALQQTADEDVQLVHLKVEHVYVTVEETKPRTNASKVLPPKPASTTEKIVVTLDGKDLSPSGDQYDKFKDALASNPYFQGVLGKTNGVTLKKLAAVDPGKNFVQFTLECRYAEKTR